MLKYEKQILLLFSSILLLILIFFVSIKLSPDSKTYLKVSETITGLNSLSQILEPLYLTSYLIFKLISLTNNFEFIFKCLNVLCFSTIIIFTLKILKYYQIRFNSYFEYLYFLILFFFNYEIIQWTKFALTDLFLLALMMVSIYYFLVGKYTISISLFLLSLLIKPQSVFIFFSLSFLFFLKRKNTQIFFIIYFCFYLILILILILFKNLNLELDFYLLNVAEKIFIEKLIEGNVVDDRYFVDYSNFFSAFKIYFFRLIYFFSFFFDQYSLNHKIYKILFFSLLYFPIIIFIFKKKKNLNKSFVVFSVGCTVIISIFVILTFIDYDLRYRLYIYPFIIMISTYCFVEINFLKKLNLKK
jgi:hypothetical protein